MKILKSCQLVILAVLTIFVVVGIASCCRLSQTSKTAKQSTECCKAPAKDCHSQGKSQGSSCQCGHDAPADQLKLSTDKQVHQSVDLIIDVISLAFTGNAHTVTGRTTIPHLEYHSVHLFILFANLRL